jgi:MFS family permease
MAQNLPQASVRRKIFGLHPNVFFLGLTSFFNDISSEMIFTLLPLFLTNILGVSTVIVGLIGGISGSADAVVRILSGWFSDKIGHRKAFAVAGYALSAVVKPFMYIAASWGVVTGIRFIDRVGKGVRNAPRDALLTESVSASERGKAFGIHRAMDTAGAVLGLAAVAAIIWIVQRNDQLLELPTFHWIVIIGAIPGFIGTLVVLSLVRESRMERKKAEDGKIATRAAAAFSKRFKIYMAILAVFTLGNTSDFFVILRAQNLGNSLIFVALILVMFNLIYSSVSAPAGMLSDKLGRRRLIMLGWVIYAVVYLGFAVANASWQVWFLFAAYGAYYAVTEGVSRAFVADLVPVDRKGTAFGWYYGVLSIFLLPASLIAGYLWSAVSPASSFYFGAAMSLAAAIAMFIFMKEEKRAVS